MFFSGRIFRSLASFHNKTICSIINNITPRQCVNLCIALCCSTVAPHSAVTMLIRSKPCRWEFGYLKDPNRVHVLVQDGNRARIVQWNELCSNPELCRKAFPLEPGEEKLKELIKSMEGQAHAHETMEAIAAIAKVCAAADLVRMQEQQAWCELPLRQMSLALAETFPCENSVVIRAKISLLKVLIETGQTEYALGLGEELLKKEDGCGWPKNDPDRLRLLNNLGAVYISLHRFREAHKALEECKELAEKSRDDLQVARVLNNLGLVFQEQNRDEEAKEYLEKCRSYFTQYFEQQNPNLSKCLKDLGDADGTEEAKNMGDWLKEIGKEYPEVATCLNNLGISYGKLKNSVSQRKTYYEHSISQRKMYYSAWKIHLAHLGKDHPHVAFVLNNMVASMVEEHKKSEEWGEAEETLKSCLRVQEQHFGKDHPAVTPVMSNLGVFYGERRKHEDEKIWLERCLEIQKKHEEYLKEHLKEQFQPDDKNIAVTLSNLGNACRSLHERGVDQDHHNRDQALENYDQSLKRRARFILAKHLGTVAMCNDNLGDAPFAKNWLQRCMQIEKQEWGSDHQDLVPIMTKSAQIYIDLKDYDQARDLLIECLQLYEHRFPSESADSPQIGECLYNLGTVAILREDYAQAKTLFERCLKAYENHHDGSDSNVEETLKHLSLIYIRLKDQRAIDTFNRCIQIQEDCLDGAQHDFVRRSAVEFEGVGDYEKAEQLLKRCLMIENQNPGELMDTMGRFVKVYERSLLPNKQLLQRCLKIEIECFGESRTETLKKFVLRFCDLPKGSLDQLAESSLEMKEDIFGKEDVQLTVELKTLAKEYRKLSKNQKERAVLKRCVKIEEHNFGRNDLKLSKTLFDLGLACRDWHEGSKVDSERKKALDQAFAALDRCHDIHQHLDRGEVTEALIEETKALKEETLSELGQVCRESKNLQRAQELLEDCLTLRKIRGDRRKMSKCLFHLADVHADLGNCTEAGALYKTCLEIVRALQLELKGIADPELDEIVEAAEHNAKLLRSAT